MLCEEKREKGWGDRALKLGQQPLEEEPKKAKPAKAPPPPPETLYGNGVSIIGIGSGEEQQGGRT